MAAFRYYVTDLAAKITATTGAEIKAMTDTDEAGILHDALEKMNEFAQAEDHERKEMFDDWELEVKAAEVMNKRTGREFNTAEKTAQKSLQLIARLRSAILLDAAAQEKNTKKSPPRPDGQKRRKSCGPFYTGHM